jgi:hypothetical protein
MPKQHDVLVCDNGTGYVKVSFFHFQNGGSIRFFEKDILKKKKALEPVRGKI